VEAGEGGDGAVPIEFSWAGETARHVGTVVHRLLCRMARHDPARWARGGEAFSLPAIRAALRALGVPPDALAAAADKVRDALTRTLADPKGAWVLQPHREARSEYALTAREEGGVHSYIIDRTFIDGEGTRWIVDYKTGGHEGGALEDFLDREQQRYRAQLESYAALLRRLEPDRPIRLGLYFPLLSAWREWEAGEGGEAES
jgi:ATP-dependent exoDNAse (exonuclease V) beta subunit